MQAGGEANLPAGCALFYLDANRRVEDGASAREVTARQLPIATELAGVDMKLDPDGVRELHWHAERALHAHDGR